MNNFEQTSSVNPAKATTVVDRVSVCIPSYNSARYIGETIKSVLDSTYPNLEIIVNDNASTDNTREIVQSFDNQRIRFFQNESNLGPVENWNRAIKRAQGKFVGLLYSDDLYGPFWLTWAIHVLRKHPHIGWVATAYRLVNENGQTLGVVSCLPETREYNLSETFQCVAKLDGLGPGFIARREILEQAGYYDVEAGLSADNDLFLRLASRHPFCYSHYPHVTYRVHPSSLTSTWETVQQTTEGFRHLNKVFSDDTLSEELGQYKRLVYADFYRKVQAKSQRLLEEGDFETVQQLEYLLHANGYKD